MYRSHLWGREKQGRQLGAQLDGSQVQKVPAKIHSQDKLKTQMRKCEPAKLRKQVKEKTKASQEGRQ